MIDLDDLDQVRLYDSQRRQQAAAAWRDRLAAGGLAEPQLDALWLDSCLPEVVRRLNPAKQLAQQLYERTPLFWGAGPMGRLAGEWQRAVMHTAEAGALSADLDQMARDWSMVRLPRFWPNILVCTWLSDGSESEAERTLAERLQRMLQKRRFTTTAVAIPRGAEIKATLWQGGEFGQWVALYLAALYGVDPTDRVAWQYLDLT
jgi:hypothetical protein